MTHAELIAAKEALGIHSRLVQPAAIHCGGSVNSRLWLPSDLSRAASTTLVERASRIEWFQLTGDWQNAHKVRQFTSSERSIGCRRQLADSLSGVAMKPNVRATAFLLRSLRQESRLFSHHVMRAGLALTVFMLFVVGLLTYANRGGTGGNIILRVMTCCYWFVTLLGGIYFSTTIVEEKEEQTLPLLRMTGASAFSILIGKSLPRLVCVVLLILVIMPFVLLAITLGGVDLRGVLTAVLGILVYAVMCSQIGLLSSVISKDAQRAFSKSLMMWAFLEFLPFWCWLGSYALGVWGKFGSLGEAQNFLDAGVFGEDFRAWQAWGQVNLEWLYMKTGNLVLYRNLSDYLIGFSFDGLWQPQMTAQLVVAVAAFLLSWALFEPFTSRSVAGAEDSQRKLSRKSRSRPWNASLIWKAWRHQTGGLLWFVMRLVGIPAMVVGLAYGAAFVWNQKTDPEAVGLTLIAAGTVVAIAHVAILFGRLFNNEIKDKTLSSLLLLPVSRHRIVAHSVIGLLPAVVASTSCLFCGIGVMMYHNGGRGNRSVFEEIWFYQLIAHGVTSILLGLRLSVRLTYGGMLLGVVLCWILGPICFALTSELIQTFFNWPTAQYFGAHVLPVILFIIEPPLWLFLYFGIIRSLERTAEKA